MAQITPSGWRWTLSDTSQKENTLAKINTHSNHQGKVNVNVGTQNCPDIRRSEVISLATPLVQFAWRSRQISTKKTIWVKCPKRVTEGLTQKSGQKTHIKTQSGAAIKYQNAWRKKDRLYHAWPYYGFLGQIGQFGKKESTLSPTYNIRVGCYYYCRDYPGGIYSIYFVQIYSS